MGKLDEFVNGCSGYHINDAEDRFPWDATNGIWYSLITVEEGQIVKYGFTAAKGSKQKLCETLKHIELVEDAVLLGVWNGQYKTHLFVLDIEKSIEHLEQTAPTIENEKE